MSKLLINESPLQVLPGLAVKIGLNEAVILQQMHYWLNHSKNFRDGRKWVFKTYREWQLEFPFWTERTVKRVFASLEKMELVISTSEYNEMSIDKTKWYSIDYDKLEEITIDAFGPSIVTNCPVDGDKMARPEGQIVTTNNHKTTSLDFNNNNDQAEPESEKPKAKDEDQNPIRFYERNIGPASPYLMNEILQWADEYSDTLIIEAMKRSLEANKRSWGYIKSILMEWVHKNVRTIEDIQALDIEFKNSRSAVAGNKQAKRKRPGEEDLNLDD
ncbi:DnaD domain-containing protein [Jeotgalibacillus aurantiacus]|uniref:DnaD domain-containing protein n=1 Tax=Jeotgalibacillus aurantiacus TaxID=2763266 RepID=UPI001D0A0CBA|nr:DnaD domain protein [Jeotgalibacillus aurantiacus]